MTNQTDVALGFWCREGWRAKLRSSINRLLIERKSPQDKRGEAIQLVTEQMEALVPQYVERRVEVA